MRRRGGSGPKVSSLLGKNSSRSRPGKSLGRRGALDSVEGKPWLDETRFEQQTAAGGAGVSLHKQLQRSKSTGIKI
jgi:hypothetical protein